VAGREHVPVGNKEEALILILQSHPVLQCTVVISEVQPTCRPHARKHAPSRSSGAQLIPRMESKIGTAVLMLMDSANPNYSARSRSGPRCTDQGVEAALSLAHNHRRRRRQILDRSRFEATVPAIQDRVDFVLEPLLNLATMCEWLQITGQNESRAHQWLTELREQHMRHWMIGYSHPDGAATLVLQSARCLARCVQQKRV